MSACVVEAGESWEVHKLEPPRRQGPARAPGREATYGILTRRCHDCGVWTTDYRCARCLDAWRLRNGVELEDDEWDDDPWCG